MYVLRSLSVLAVLMAAFSASIALSPARADVLITIDKSAQKMTVAVDGKPLYVWPVSTGVSGHDTPSGEFKPFRMERDHFSREWDDAPMPNSIFFTQTGHAIHGSGHVRAIGTPASHGCVRLERKNASILFDLVKHQHMSNTRVVLTGETPEVAAVPVARNRGYQRTVRNADNVDATALAAQRRQRSTRGYNDDQRPVYYRVQPYYYAPPRGRAPFPLLPFGW